MAAGFAGGIGLSGGGCSALGAAMDGREESIDEHAAYLRDGGCSEIFDALVTHPLAEPNGGTVS